MNTRIAKLLLASALALGATAIAQAETVILRQGLNGYTGTQDTGIYNRRTFNYGGTTALFIGNQAAGHDQRILLKFDLSEYAGRTVQGDVTLTMYQAPSSYVGSFEVGIYQVSAANADWVQGTGTGAVAAADGEPNWDYRQNNSDTASRVGWAGSGGLSTAGIDYVAAPVAILDYDTAKGFTAVSVVISASVIQGWIDNPETNGGLLFMRINPGENATAFGRYRTSRESSSEHARPTLTFDLVAVPEASTQAMIFAAAAVGTLAVLRRRRRN